MAKRAFASNSLLVIQPAFDVAAYADALERYRITVLTAVPTMFARLVKEPALLQGRDLSALRRVMLGSAPMTVALRARRVRPASRRLAHAAAGGGPSDRSVPRPPGRRPQSR
ncbi:hypothetical protein G6F31_018838 [Rhizopus arrhizus]|nr:hypothetical protein G6F31_018838 [Rhizopus arrhizus]